MNRTKYPEVEPIMVEIASQTGMDGDPEELELRMQILHQAVELIADTIADTPIKEITGEEVSALLKVFNEYVMNTRLALCGGALSALNQQ